MWPRYVVIGGVVVVVLLAALWFLGPSIQIDRWIADLHAVNPKTVKAAREALVTSKLRQVDERLADDLGDDSLPFRVRVVLGDVLVERHRLERVEQVLRQGSAAGRHAALATIYSRIGKLGLEWFQREYVARAEYGVPDLLVSWLQEPRTASRSVAAKIAAAAHVRKAIPALRAIVRGEGDLGTTREQRAVLSEAAQALISLGDCEAVPLFVEPARHEPTDLARLRMMQALHQAVRGEKAPCPDAVPAETVRDVVLEALDGPPHTRQGALLILKAEPEWALAAQDEILRILDDSPVHEFHRRHALDALASTRDPDFARRLPRYFHDPDPYVRSEAAMAALGYQNEPKPPLQYADAFVGLIENEHENDNAFFAAMGGLKRLVGRWVGLPPEIVESAAKGGQEWVAFRDRMFREGKSHGLTRAEWARLWWEAWAKTLGLSDEEIDKGWAAREAFWKAAGKGDAAAARASLEASPRHDDGLFTYEEGWLDAHGA